MSPNAWYETSLSFKITSGLRRFVSKHQNVLLLKTEPQNFGDAVGFARCAQACLYEWRTVRLSDPKREDNTADK